MLSHNEAHHVSAISKDRVPKTPMGFIEDCTESNAARHISPQSPSQIKIVRQPVE
jgi:hypothetical protein